MRSLFLCLLLIISTSAFAFDNVLFISIDTLRSDYVSCYGSKKVSTPNIDSLAQNGIVFRNTVSPAPFTLPSHTSMLTGLVPPVHQVLDNGGFYLDPGITTLPEMMKGSGMQTSAFVSSFPLDSRFGLDQGFDLYDDGYPAVNNVNEFTMPERNAEETVNAALQWLQEKKASHWFVFLHLYDPHFPYRAPQTFQDKYPKDLYAAEVAYADQQVGRVLEFLKKEKLETKTLVVLTSDHGESLGEHQEGTHGIFGYESTLRVPLILSPFVPKVVNARVRLIDIAPTILALQKASPFPSRTQGVSLLKYWENPNSVDPVSDSYFEAVSMYLNAGWAPLRGFYSGNMKYIDLPQPELYDLSKDPGETKNLCSDGPLCTTWSTRFISFSRPFQRPSAPRNPVSREEMEQLKALGYVTGAPSEPKKNFTANDDPKNLIVYHNRIYAALSFYNKGYDLKALDILEKIIEERPDYSVAYLHAGFIRSSIGFPDKAIELMKQAIQNGVTDIQIYGKLGLYLYEAGKYEEAIRQLQFALKRDSRDLDNQNYLGMSYAAIKQYPEAEKAFRAALASDPSDAMTIDNLATLYLTQKRFDEAAKQYEAALAINKHLGGAYNGLGVVYASQKKWDLAIKNWESSLHESPDNYDAMLNLAYAYLETKQKDRALELLLQFSKNAPKSRYASDLSRVNSLIRQLQ